MVFCTRFLLIFRCIISQLVINSLGMGLFIVPWGLQNIASVMDASLIIIKHLPIDKSKTATYWVWWYQEKWLSLKMKLAMGEVVKMAKERKEIKQKNRLPSGSVTLDKSFPSASTWVEWVTLSQLDQWLKAFENPIEAKDPLLRKRRWCLHIKSCMWFWEPSGAQTKWPLRFLVTRLDSILPVAMLPSTQMNQWVSLDYLNQLTGMEVVTGDTLHVHHLNSLPSHIPKVFHWSPEKQDVQLNPLPLFGKCLQCPPSSWLPIFTWDGSSFLACFSLPLAFLLLGKLAGQCCYGDLTLYLE